MLRISSNVMCIRENKVIQLLTSLNDAEIQRISIEASVSPAISHDPGILFRGCFPKRIHLLNAMGRSFWERRPRKIPLKTGELSQEDNRQGF